MNNFYAILDCAPNATAAEIKRNYQRLVKKYHPDKGAQTTERFQLIDKAYKTLKDEKSRKDYDSFLLADNCRQESLIYAELSKEKLVLNNEGIALYPCRCGEQFIIEQEHLNEPECIIECSECSNCVSIR